MQGDIIVENPKIKLALAAWTWCADAKNNEPVVDNPERLRFAVGLLHKRVFGKATKQAVSEILDLLQSVGVVSESFHDATGGRPKELREIATDWLRADRATELTELLTKALQASQADDLAQEKKATAEIALKVYDFLCDAENTEIDYSNAQVFSIKRLCREIPDATEGLSVLEYRQVISKSFEEPNARKRRMSRLNQRWFTPNGRDELIKILTPPSAVPWYQAGPLRALHDFLVVREASTQKIAAGTIIKNEPLCKFLIEKGPFPVAPLDQSDACSCTITTCRFKFNAGDYTPLDHPVLFVLRDFYFGFNSTVLRFKGGDVISRRDLAAFLTGGNAHWPVAVAAPNDYSVCPRCKHVARRAVLLGENLAAAS